MVTYSVLGAARHDVFEFDVWHFVGLEGLKDQLINQESSTLPVRGVVNVYKLIKTT